MDRAVTTPPVRPLGLSHIVTFLPIRVMVPAGKAQIVKSGTSTDL